MAAETVATPRVMPRLVSLRLLAKYIAHVKLNEGVAYLHATDRHSWSEFTDAEWALLQAIEAQADGR